LPVFKSIYEVYAGVETLPGAKLSLNLGEFEMFTASIPLVNDLFS